MKYLSVNLTRDCARLFNLPRKMMQSEFISDPLSFLRQEIQRNLVLLECAEIVAFLQTRTVHHYVEPPGSRTCLLVEEDDRRVQGSSKPEDILIQYIRTGEDS